MSRDDVIRVMPSPRFVMVSEKMKNVPAVRIIEGFEM